MPAQTRGAAAPARHDMSVILVTGSYDHDIRDFWEAWSGILFSHDLENRRKRSPSSKRLLAAAIYKKVNIYEIASTSSTPLFTFEGHNSNVTAVCFHSEGKWLVTGSEDGTIKIWDLRSTHLHRNYDNEAPGTVHLSNSRLDADIWGWTVTDVVGKCFVWRINEERSELPRFQAVTKFQAHSKYLTRCLLSPDVKYLATCSADTTVKIWSISPNYEFRLEKILQGHQRWVWDCAFSADSAYLVTASSDHTARLWEMASGETLRFVVHYTTELDNNLVFSLLPIKACAPPFVNTPRYVTLFLFRPHGHTPIAH
ncbi:hypothetical protein NM688_g4649 [Phlebia brevispora]|uniref:Uncharacterized protein n=1 Tax=Phlebia brevispora TaxID=194682 RepID=A0ACC1T2M9_9APHY|nr:hypothetical protein NM688_g4649 [Phlebia brevispora]